MVNQFVDTGHAAAALDAQPLRVSRRHLATHNDRPVMCLRADSFAVRNVLLLQEIGNTSLQANILDRVTWHSDPGTSFFGAHFSYPLLQQDTGQPNLPAVPSHVSLRERQVDRAEELSPEKPEAD